MMPRTEAYGGRRSAARSPGGRAVHPGWAGALHRLWRASARRLARPVGGV